MRENELFAVNVEQDVGQANRGCRMVREVRQCSLEIQARIVWGTLVMG